MNSNYDASDSSIKPKAQKNTSKIEMDSKPSKFKEENCSKPRVVSNKNGPKTAWVPKSNKVGFDVCREEEIMSDI